MISLRNISRRQNTIRLLKHNYNASNLILLRTNATSKSKKIGSIDHSAYDFIRHEGQQDNSSQLPFDRIRHSETFGQLVVSEKLRKNDELNKDTKDHVHRSNESQDQIRENYDDEYTHSPFRNPDGSFIQGDNSEEARLHPLTLEGRANRSIAKLPEEIAKVINQNILSMTVPDKLRERCANIYQSISKEQIQQVPNSSLDCDAHIAALFLQNYSHSNQILLELQKRVGKDNFNPRSVLDIGYGPGTGMVALNEIMGDDWVPDVKDIYVVGRKNNEMKKRAKIILSRQRNENLEEVEVSEDGVELENEQLNSLENDNALNKELDVSQTEDVLNELNINEEQENEFEDPSDYIGPVNAAKIKIKSRLRDTLPVTKKYDLIMVNQSLLTREYNFPNDIDTNIHMILKLLKPNGHLILIERGNALGFETIARARQVMIRPESFNHETGKIPRPYIKGSSIKPQKLKKEDQLIDDNDIEFEEKLLAELDKELDGEEIDGINDIDEFEKEINDKYGEPSEDDLKFEFEGSEEFDVIPIEAKSESNDAEQASVDSKLNSESVDYHISIIAPCSHHSKCPLQLGDPKYYKIPSHKHKLGFCSFDRTVERPKYTMELKKGRRLATKWDKTSEDGFGLNNLSKGTLKSLSGTGRPNSNNTETGSFSYLIAQRSSSDVKSIKKIEYERQHYSSISIDEKDPNHWPRIISNPTKIKKNVKLTVSAPSGNIEVWQVPKSLGKQIYHDVRKSSKGDLWPHSKKSVIVKNQLSDKVREKLDVLSKTQKKTFLKEQSKKKWKKLKSRDEGDFEHDIVTIADSIATTLENSKNYIQKGKRAKFDVNPRDYDGK